MAWINLDGKRFYYGTGGKGWEPELPAVVFVHGAGGDHTVWNLQTRALAHAGWNVMALDCPGHGASDDLAELTTVEQLADWLVAMLDAAGLERVSLVGHSLGAGVALTVAGQHPDRVQALALVGTSLTMPVNEQLLHDTLHDQPAAVDFITGFGLDRRYQLGASPAPGMWMVGSVRALLLRCPPAMLHRDFKIVGGWDGAPYAAKVAAPTLVIAGENDRMTPAKNGKAMAVAIAGAEYLQLPGIGHMLPNEAPREVMKALRTFLAAQCRQAA
jgi:pimeloyl-ACP methyl ester carboxylesterase